MTNKSLTGRLPTNPEIQDLRIKVKVLKIPNAVDLDLASLEATYFKQYKELATMNTLQALKNDMALSLYGVTTQEAQEKGICISCKQLVGSHNIHAPSGQKEYLISGLCECCWAAMFE